MKDAIDVLEILQSQHAEVDELIEKIEESDGERAVLFDELADKLAAHATVEEKLFYPSVMSGQTDELLYESVEAHLEIKRVLADMLGLDPDEDASQFDVKLALLKRAVSHHAHDEEEGKLFPIVRESLTDDERAALGDEVLAMFEELLPRHPCEDIPSEIDEPAPLPAP